MADDDVKSASVAPDTDCSDNQYADAKFILLNFVITDDAFVPAAQVSFEFMADEGM